MRKALLVVFAIGCLLLPQCSAQDKAKKATLAVFDFKVASNTEKAFAQVSIRTEKGEESVKGSFEIKKETSALTDKFITAIVKTNKINVVERDRMDSMMNEFKLTESGITDSKQSEKAGKVLGADYLLHGTISLFTASVKYDPIPYTERFNKIAEAQMAVDIRLVETETGKIVVAETANEKVLKRVVVKVSDSYDVPSAVIEELHRKVVDSLVISVVDGIYPTKVASYNDNIFYLNRGKDSGVKEGDLYKIFVPGKEIRDPDTNSVIGREDREVAIVEITEIQNKLSKASLKKWKAEFGKSEDVKDILKGAFARRFKEEDDSLKGFNSENEKESVKLPGTDD